jgi:hypothetical protein
MRASNWKEKREAYRLRNGQQLAPDLNKQRLFISAALGTAIEVIVICEYRGRSQPI